MNPKITINKLFYLSTETESRSRSRNREIEVHLDSPSPYFYVVPSLKIIKYAIGKVRRCSINKT